MRRAAIALAVLASGCPHRAPREVIATPPAGVSIAFYRSGAKSYTVVDDRRWVEVTGGMLFLDHIDPGAALPSLVIEPLGGGALVVGQCDRAHETQQLSSDDALRRYGEWQQRRAIRRAEGEGDVDPEPAPENTLTVVAPVVRCNAGGAQGKQLVRLLYVSTELSYRAQHDVTMTTSDRATIATRFAIEAPNWGGRADISLFEGLPGGDLPPIELARGSLPLDGSTSVLGAPPRDVSARARRVFDGATRSGVGDATDPSWGRDSVHAVWVWLELADVRLTPGAAHAHLELPGEEIRDIDVPAAGREETPEGTRLPVWIDDQLRATRTRNVTGSDGASLADRFLVSVTNTGSEPREVWIEEKLRPAKRRAVKSGWPVKPVITGDLTRTKVLVKPGATERIGYLVEYVF